MMIHNNQVIAPVSTGIIIIITSHLVLLSTCNFITIDTQWQQQLDSRVSEKENSACLCWRHCWQTHGGKATQLFVYLFARWRF